MPLPHAIVTIFLVSSTLFIGCGGRRSSGQTPNQMDDDLNVQTIPPIHVSATRDGEKVTLEAYDAAALFERATGQLRSGDCNAAIGTYNQLIEEFPKSDLVAYSLYNKGLCADDLKSYKTAVGAYSTLIEQFPESTDVKDALFRLGGSYEKLEAWDDAARVFTKLLEGDYPIVPIEKVEALARKGAALANLKRNDEARILLEDAIRVYRHNPSIRPTDSIFHYSMAQFKLGEMVHDQMRTIQLPTDEKTLPEVLETKAQLLLDAQYLYTKVIRIGHAHWAAAAAYRIGALYHHLWEDMLNAPPPEDLTDEEIEIYREILQENTRVLLTKAVKQWERTMKLAIRLGLDNEWIDSTKKDLKKIREILEMEQTDE